MLMLAVNKAFADLLTNNFAKTRIMIFGVIANVWQLYLQTTTNNASGAAIPQPIGSYCVLTVVTTLVNWKLTLTVAKNNAIFIMSKWPAIGNQSINALPLLR